MKKFVFAAASAAAFAASPASALNIVNNGASSSVQVFKTDLLSDFIIKTDGSTANSDGLFAEIRMELASFTANSFTFNYTITNKSIDPAALSRLGQFGFNVSPGAPANSASGSNFTVALGANDYFRRPNNNNGNFNGLGGREICLSAGTANNCNGGGNDGILSGVSNSKVGRLIFTYAGAQQSITFSNFVTRWQAGQNGSSASGGSVTIVPEPATWAMMIGGFGLVGGALRRRRTADKAVLA